MFLIEESPYSNEQINEVYVQIMKYHSDYDNIPMISHNLNKFPINYWFNSIWREKGETECRLYLYKYFIEYSILFE